MIETKVDPAEVVLRLQVLETLHKLAVQADRPLAYDLISQALAAFARDFPHYF